MLLLVLIGVALALLFLTRLMRGIAVAPAPPMSPAGRQENPASEKRNRSTLPSAGRDEVKREENTRNPQDTAEHREILNGLDGCECIFKESQFIWLVRVTHVEVNGWGVAFTLEIVGAPGFSDKMTEGFSVDAAWEALSVYRHFVFARYVSWMLINGTNLVDQIKSLAENTKDRRLLLKGINDLLWHPPAG